MLKWFGPNEGEAKSAYRRFVKKGIAQGCRPDLVGGGLVKKKTPLLCKKINIFRLALTEQLRSSKRLYGAIV